MSNSLTEIEKKFTELEVRFSEIENLNQFLAQQAKEYFLLFDSIRKLNTTGGIKQFFKSLDTILHKGFDIDEFSLILQNDNSDLLTIHHSFGLPKRKLREMFYRPNEGLAGKVFVNKQAVYIPDASVLRGFTYYGLTKNIQGSLYYLPILDRDQNGVGVMKLRKVVKNGFSDVERSVLPNLQNELGNSLMNARKIELLNTKSYVDEVTHLYNWLFYADHFPIEFKRAQRYQRELSLIFIEIENFKNLVTHTGPDSINDVLRKAGVLLKELTRSSDICVHFSTAKFLLILPETGRQAAYEVALKLKKAFENMAFELNGDLEEPEPRFPMGIAGYPQDTIEPKVLIELAERALLQAKKNLPRTIAMAED